MAEFNEKERAQLLIFWKTGIFGEKVSWETVKNIFRQIIASPDTKNLNFDESIELIKSKIKTLRSLK